jgi:SAM-dependent methyltransferase
MTRVPDTVNRADMAAVRRLLSRHLLGSGVELGPGHQPFPLAFPGAEVAYVDRWEPDENRGLFPELGSDASFPKPDYVCNIDTDRLKVLADASQDFVIASHILEHVADPIGLIDEINRVLRPGGVALILLPDRRRTFDRHRVPTSLEHLVAEYERGVTEVDDAHVLEFLEKTSAPDEFRAIVEGPEDERRAGLDLHRQRSIHVHCWADDEFLPVLTFSIRSLGHRWEFVDGVLPDDEGPDGIEFGYVLTKTGVEVGGDVLADRLAAAWSAWAQPRRQLHQRLHRLAAVESSLPYRALRRAARAGRSWGVRAAAVVRRSEEPAPDEAG